MWDKSQGKVTTATRRCNVTSVGALDITFNSVNVIKILANASNVIKSGM